MALRVWLPLNGSLENIGISDVEVINSGATVSDDGKIGKCYSFDGTNDQIITSYECHEDQLSVCVWVYFTKLNIHLLDMRDASGNGYQPMYISSSSGVQVGGTNSSFIYIPYTFNLNTWYHVCVTMNANETCLYINGSYINKTTSAKAANFNKTMDIHLGSRYNGQNWFGGKINDFRLYNHCLSAKEVKEISQGLILHYKLNGWSGGVGDNILTGTATQTTVLASETGMRANGTWSQASSGNGVHAVINIENDTPVPCVNWGFQITNNTSGNRDFAQRDQPYKNGVTYTVSWYMRGTGKYLVRQWNTTDGKQMQSKTGNVDTTEWTYYTWTFTATEELETDECTLHLGATGATSLLEWCAMKMEIGSVATPWSPAPEDLDIDTNAVIDCSGYGNNGEIIGAIATETDPERYLYSAHISSTSSKIKISGLTTTGFGNSYSFAWWAKVSSTTPMHWGFSDGIRLNGLHTGRLWNTGDSSDNPLYTPGTTTQVTAPTKNVWHHWVMTGDGTTCKVYQDGVFWGQAKTYKAISGTTIYINGWDTSTSYSSDNYSISDFRIYATALSAEDILDLYHTPVNVDNLGGVHGFEFNEIQTNSLSDFSAISSNWVADGVTVSYINDSLGGPTITAVPSSGNKRIYHNVSNVWNNGSAYLVSFLAKCSANDGTIRPSRSIADWGPTFNITTDWQQYYGLITSTTTADGGTLSLSFSGSSTYYVSNIKLEPANQNLISVLKNGVIKENWIDENNFTANASLLKTSSNIVGNHFIEK